MWSPVGIRAKSVPDSSMLYEHIPGKFSFQFEYLQVMSP